MYRLCALLLILASLVLTGCKPRVDADQEKAAILAINEAVGQAHFEHDAAKFLSHNAQEWYSVRDGKVLRRKKDEAVIGLDQYLKSVDFKEVTAITPPEIQISEDGRMAWLIGNVRVRGIQKQPNGVQTEIAFVSTWLSVYQKQGSEWYLVATATTEREEPKLN
jgi:hypothetical protein